MKKTFTRALSLILVLVTLIGVMPMAFALEADEMEAASFTVNSNEVALKVGETHQISVTGMTTDNGDVLAPEEINVTFTTDAPSDGLTVSDSGLITAKKAGNYDVQVIGKGTRTGWSFTHVGVAQITVAVTEETTPPAGDGEGDEEPEVTYEVKLNPATLKLAVGEESEALEVIVNKFEDGEAAGVLASSKYSIEGWLAAKKDGKDIVTVDGDGKVTGVAAGTTTVEVSIKLEGETEERVGTCTITVEEAASAVIECKNGSIKAGESYTLKPVLKIGGKEVSEVEFDFVRSGQNTAIAIADNKKSATFSNANGGLVEITISVTKYKVAGDDKVISGDDVKVEPLKVQVYFYKNHDLEMTLREGKTKVSLTEDKVFTQIALNGQVLNSLYNDFSFDRMFGYLLTSTYAEPKPYEIEFDYSNSPTIGHVADSFGDTKYYQPWDTLDQAYFKQIGTRTGKASFGYKILDKEGLILMTGTCSVTIVGGEGDVHYETTTSKNVTLKESDFQAFWTAQSFSKQHTLNYVTFDVLGMRGTLYTDSTKKTAVTNGMRFFINPARGEYDLGAVYYVPKANDASEYVDSITFKAFGIYTTTFASGTMSIGVNTKAASNITSRGVVIGTTYTKTISDAFKSNSGTTLGYVVFDLPEAKYGKLYSKLPSETKVVHGSAMNMTYVAEGTLLKKDDAVWNGTASTTDLELSDVAFIPAAGFKGEVELTYTAYDAYGKYPYTGTLRFNVSAKTASGIFSDVTSKSYSWAADSADFLYYEGVAQGSKAAGSNTIKYNPSANITRRDFMLMLYRAFLAKNYSTFNVTSNFPDVVKGTDAYSKEIYQAVGVAKYLGIAQGSNDKFNPKANITRQEAMVLIYRTLDVINKNLEYTTTANVAAFKDANKISSWATSAITYLVNHGVIQGSNDKINPSSNITRAEMACILHRVLTY